MNSQGQIGTAPPETSLGPLKGERRANWIRLRTMILLRWFAIIGQITAITVAQRVYGLQLELGLCYMAIGTSVIGNLIAIFVFPENKRLTEAENLLMVLFDLLQLSFLLYLTGGLNNPFSLLILGPVTISSAVLSLRSTLFLGATAILVVSILAEYHLPLRTEQGFVLRIPEIFVFGTWVAIVIGVIFIGIYARRITQEMHSMSDALQATQMALSREQKLTDLGGVVAAAAHELGTPLATITLASSELAEELTGELREDAELIREQADRCRDILRGMGRAGKDDTLMRQAPLSTVLREAAEPHMDRDKTIHFSAEPAPGAPSRQPSVLRRPEIVHGLRNLVQNAVDFARSEVWIEALWTDDAISVRIADNGPGFPANVIGRIGDPFVSRRRATGQKTLRPGYEGMGLGLFIAKTLLERSGAELSFANGTNPFLTEEERGARRGAIVEVAWPRSAIEADANLSQGGYPENRAIEL